MSDHDRTQTRELLTQAPELRMAQPEVAPWARSPAPAHPVHRLQQAAGNRLVQTLLARQAGGNGRPIPGRTTQAALNGGGGQPLPANTRASMERALGADLSRVRTHTDLTAAGAARELNAQAFNSGQDVYFGAGRYQPSTTQGQRLLSHELTHTIQQGTSPSSVSRSPAGPSLAVSQRDDPLEQEAEAVADRVVAGRPILPGSISAAIDGGQESLARDEDQAAPPAVVPTPTQAADEETAATPGAPTEPVPLQGASTFAPSPAWQSYLEAQGQQGATVPVCFGNLARGDIRVRKQEESYQTGTGRRDREQAIRFTHPALEPLRETGVQPVLVLSIQDSTISGYASIARGDRFISQPTALMDAIREHSDALGWVGIDVSRFPNVQNALENGTFHLRVNDFPFRLGGWVSGTGAFGLENETVTFNATATVSVRGLTEAQLEIARNEEGQLTGQVEVPVMLNRFSGNILAQYTDGTVNVRGTVRYADEKFSGEITLLVTDPATARNVALEQLGPEAVETAAQETRGRGSDQRARPGERALAGWGTLDFAFTEWLSGRAQVIVDNEGHITVIGEITPQAEVELFPQRDFIYHIFTFEVRARYGVPLVGSIFLFANIGMDALAKLGPGKIYNIAVRGRYSTDPRVFNEFSIEATLNISAFAGLRLRAEGGAGLELLGHDIKAGVGVNALAGVRGYVEATPTIGYRERAAPEEGRQGEFYIRGHMELAAQPFLGLSGDLFVELDSPWWSPAPDKKWTWPIGSLEYPLPGEFGIGADVDYVIGSDQLPEIQFGEVDFNKDKFMTDLINDKVPPKSQGEQERQGEWQGGETTGESAEPTQVDSQGPPADEPARGRQESGEGEPPKPEAQQRWLQGLQTLGRLATESQAHPLDRRTLEGRLASIKRQYQFSELRVETSGEDWAVYPRMNPDAPQPTIIEGTQQDGSGVTAQPAAPAPTGKTQSDPIPMIWYKPPGLYPPSIQLGDDRYFFNEPEPLVVPPVAGLTDVRGTASTGGEIIIGIDTSGPFYPRVGNVWPRVLARPLRTGVRQANFRRLLEEHGYDWGSKEADHVRDLQWGGDDDYRNLWPLERTWNNAANRILRQDVTYQDDSGTDVTGRLEDTPRDRWFRIENIQRP